MDLVLSQRESLGDAGRSRRRNSRKPAYTKRNYNRAKAAREKRVVGGVKRGSRGNSKAIKLYNNPLSHVAIPDRVEVSLCTTMCGYWSAGRLTAAAGNFFSVMVNSIVSPFDTSIDMTTGTGTYSFASNAQLVQGYAITNNPLSYVTLSGLYDNYRVMRYALEVTVQPSVSSDALRFVLIPTGAEEIPSAVASSANLRVLEEQPYALSKTVSSAASSPGPDCTLTITGCPYKDNGLTRDQYLAAGQQTAINSQPSTAIQDYVGVFLQELNGANNSSTVMIQCKLTQVVILEGLKSQIQ